ncbi:hypothetical protein BpHYR1_025044 [Brachionus plicatilis]|uniref:Uncharacterized protein n=1 Tax=Brachionus plicatilis TaxID=10195 RepID=A0A3M7RP49_BRAPC|nr:hypothetical protein BpHYR1_025044 [Brachionus plicatilis]
MNLVGLEIELHQSRYFLSRDLLMKKSFKINQKNDYLKSPASPQHFQTKILLRNCSYFPSSKVSKILFT